MRRPGRAGRWWWTHHHVGGVPADAGGKVAEAAWFPLGQVAGALARADERRLGAAVPGPLTGIT